MTFIFWEVIIFLKMITFYKDTKMNKYKQKTGQQHKSAETEFCKGMSEVFWGFFSKLSFSGLKFIIMGHELMMLLFPALVKLLLLRKCDFTHR